MKNNNDKVIVRIPPSPTGLLHIGTARTVLFNYLFAKQNNGKVILRSEDTDKERSKKEYEDDIRENLSWLGFSFDEFHRQSERGELYKENLKKLIEEDKAYISKEEIKEEGQRSEVIRFRNPGGKITFNDLIRGEITFDVTELGDFVIAKSLDEPLYHLAVVVDDIDMQITHIIRGEDHISNTPRQILLLEALGATRPLYAHIPLILGSDKSKLSKRKHGESVSIKHYKEKGFLPEAMINFLALLGWNPGTAEEFFTINELIKIFKLEQVQKSGAIFNEVKLRSINKHYLRNLPQNALIEEIERRLPDCPPNLRSKLLPIITDRIDIFSDLDIIKESKELEFFWISPNIENVSDLKWKNDEIEATKKHLKALISLIGEGKEAIMEYAEKEGKGSVLWPLRFSLSGKEKSPDPFTIIGIIGNDESIARINKALSLLG